MKKNILFKKVMILGLSAVMFMGITTMVALANSNGIPLQITSY